MNRNCMYLIRLKYFSCRRRRGHRLDILFSCLYERNAVEPVQAIPERRDTLDPEQRLIFLDNLNSNDDPNSFEGSSSFNHISALRLFSAGILPFSGANRRSVSLRELRPAPITIIPRSAQTERNPQIARFLERSGRLVSRKSARVMPALESPPRSPCSRHVSSAADLSPYKALGCPTPVAVPVRT